MTDQQQGRTEHEVDEDRMEQAIENTEAISELAGGLVDAAVASTAAESGRTPEEQWERMGDHFAYQGAEMDPNQMQLDDYEISGEAVEVEQ